MIRIENLRKTYRAADGREVEALADIDLVVSRPADPEAAHEPTRSLLNLAKRLTRSLRDIQFRCHGVTMQQMPSLD